MSDQTPWGPPPSGPPAPPPPGGPAGGYGGGHGGGYGPPAGWGPPQAPPPQRPSSRVAVVVAAVLALVLVAVGAVAITLVVTRDDDSSDDAGSSTDTTTEPPTDTTTTDTGTSTGGAGVAGRVNGTGYSFEVPEEWSDVTSQAVAAIPAIDAAVALGETYDGAPANILLVVESALGVTDVEDLRPILAGQLADEGEETVDLPDRTIDGEPAVGVELPGTLSSSGNLVTQIGYTAIHEGQKYAAVVSFRAEGDNVSADALQAVLDTWTWD